MQTCCLCTFFLPMGTTKSRSTICKTFSYADIAGSRVLGLVTCKLFGKNCISISISISISGEFTFIIVDGTFCLTSRFRVSLHKPNLLTFSLGIVLVHQN